MALNARPINGAAINAARLASVPSFVTGPTLVSLDTSTTTVTLDASTTTVTLS